jgi:hypothetical protein
MGKWRYSSNILDLNTRWGYPAASPPGERAPPPVPIGQEAVWAPEPVGTACNRKKSLAPAGN